jgi:hypothetical protein
MSGEGESIPYPWSVVLNLIQDPSFTGLERSAWINGS